MHLPHVTKPRVTKCRTTGQWIVNVTGGHHVCEWSHWSHWNAGEQAFRRFSTALAHALAHHAERHDAHRVQRLARAGRTVR